MPLIYCLAGHHGKRSHIIHSLTVQLHQIPYETLQTHVFKKWGKWSILLWTPFKALFGPFFLFDEPQEWSLWKVVTITGKNLTFILWFCLHFSFTSAAKWHTDMPVSSLVPKRTVCLMLDEYFTSYASREQTGLRKWVTQSPTTVLAYSKAQ